jgi:D-3-phosphoglycerate dehydrogenase
MARLRVGLTRDFINVDGSISVDPQAWRKLKEAEGLELHFLDHPPLAAITRSDAAQFDILIIKRNPVTSAAVSTAGSAEMDDLRLKMIIRNGAGHDHIDLKACTDAGIMVATTPRAVSGPVASSILALMLAFAHRIPERDRLTRAGHWDKRWERLGMSLRGSTLGVIGLGNIGLELVRLAMPWEMRHLGYTPQPEPERYVGLNIELASLETVLRSADFLAICCPLTPQTRHLINTSTLGMMRPNAILINTARGEIIDESALVAALTEGRIAGAGIDVFEVEPASADNPLFKLDNVIVGSHNLAYTDELNRSANLASAELALSYLAGAIPSTLINPEVLNHPRCPFAGY